MKLRVIGPLCLAALTIAAPAHAATVSQETIFGRTSLVYSAAQGEQNNVRVGLGTTSTAGTAGIVRTAAAEEEGQALRRHGQRPPDGIRNPQGGLGQGLHRGRVLRLRSIQGRQEQDLRRVR